VSQKNKQIIILGSGGHGWQSLRQFFKKSINFDILIYGLTSDFGGSTGNWIKLLEFNNFELSKKLFNSQKEALPFGDFNKIISYFVALKHGQKTANILDFRSNILDQHIQKIEFLSNIFKLNQEIKNDLENYFKTTFKYYLENKNSLNFDLEKALCFGNLWQDFVLNKFSPDFDFNAFYHQKNILPKNIKLQFTAKKRQVLIAQDFDKKKIVGEEEIDIIEKQMDPKSFQLTSFYKNESELNSNILENLKKADFVIIPNGSVANWLPLTNDPEILQILKQKSLKQSLIWLVNPINANNELTAIHYLKYFHSKGMKPITIGNNPSFLSDYNINLKEKLYDCDEVFETLLKIIEAKI
jgi:hypothetical protein